MQVPCYNCHERVLGCHGMCVDYMEYAKILRQAGKARVEHNTYPSKIRKKYERQNKMWKTHRR